MSDAGSSGSDSCRTRSASREPGSAAEEEMRVLAVDDNNIDRKLIEMLLKTSSFKVTTCNSALRALEVLGMSGKGLSPQRRKNLEFDLIITDFCMPEMTGYDLLKRVKEESSAWKDIPVIIMSSENRPRRITKCIAEGAEEFLLKPVKLSDVHRLKGHVRQARDIRDDASGVVVPGKRKNSTSSSLPAPNLDRRARLSELTVA